MQTTENPSKVLNMHGKHEQIKPSGAGAKGRLLTDLRHTDQAGDGGGVSPFDPPEGFREIHLSNPQLHKSTVDLVDATRGLWGGVTSQQEDD